MVSTELLGGGGGMPTHTHAQRAFAAFELERLRPQAPEGGGPPGRASWREMPHELVTGERGGKAKGGVA